MYKIFLALFLVFLYTYSNSQDLIKDTWYPDDKVYWLAADKNMIYFGGWMKYIGPNTGCATILDITKGMNITNKVPLINGNVYSAASDSKGGWYIGGNFTAVQGVEQKYIAHILPDNTLDIKWRPVVDNVVRKVLIKNENLFIAGNFTRINSIQRNFLGSIKINDYQTTKWNPIVISEIIDMCILGNSVYVTGVNITQSLDATISFDINSGVMRGWRPNIGGFFVNYPLRITAGKDRIFFIGNFQMVNNKTQKYIVTLDTTNGYNLPQQINVDSPIYNFEVDNDTIYISGKFSQVNGITRNTIASINILTNKVTDWNPNLDDVASCISVSKDKVYLSGSFNSINNIKRKNFGAVEKVTGLTTEWFAGRGSYSSFSGSYISYSEKSIIVNSDLGKSVGGRLQDGLIRFDTKTKQFSEWNPKISGQINRVFLVDSSL